MQVKHALHALDESMITIYSALCNSLRADYAHSNAKDNPQESAQIDKDFQEHLKSMRNLIAKSGARNGQGGLTEATQDNNNREDQIDDRHEPLKEIDTALSHSRHVSTGSAYVATLSDSGQDYSVPLETAMLVRLACYSAEEASLAIYEVQCRIPDVEDSGPVDYIKIYQLRIDQNMLRFLTSGTKLRKKNMKRTERRLTACRRSKTTTIMCGVPKKEIQKLREVVLEIEEAQSKGHQIVCDSLQSDLSNAKVDPEKSTQIDQELQEHLHALQELKIAYEKRKEVYKLESRKRAETFNWSMCLGPDGRFDFGLYQRMRATLSAQ